MNNMININSRIHLDTAKTHNEINTRNKAYDTPSTIAHLFATLFLTAIFCASASAAQVTITSISGWTAGDVIVNGRFTGQPTFSKPAKSDAYKNMLAIESQSNDATFTVIGKNFGTKNGSVDFLDNNLNKLFTITITSWKDTEVKIVAKGPYTFTSSLGWVRVSRDVNPPPKCYDGAAMLTVKGFVGVIKTRAFGQCTWLVANRRLSVKPTKSVPTPTAYSWTDAISPTYVPLQWDGLLYGTKHVAIISSVPIKTTNKDGTTSWSFTVNEMNALTDERDYSSIKTFSVKAGKVVTSIGSQAGPNYAADKYWR